VLVFFFIVNITSCIPTLHELLVVGRAADALDGDAGIVECLLLKGGLDLLNRALLDRLGDGVQVLKRTTWYFQIRYCVDFKQSWFRVLKAFLPW
jgi:hypothetical protein